MPPDSPLFNSKIKVYKIKKIVVQVDVLIVKFKVPFFVIRICLHEYAAGLMIDYSLIDSTLYATSSKIFAVIDDDDLIFAIVKCTTM